MKTFLPATLLACFTILTAAAFAENQQQDQKELSKEEVGLLSETFGYYVGKNLATPGLNLNLERIIKGLRDGYARKEAPMDEQEYQAKMMEYQTQALNRMSDDNLKSANEFLANNKNQPGVKVIDEGKLQYKVLNEGKGEVVKEHSTPEVHYSGSFIDGTEFGNSREMGNPIKVPLDQTIPGFSKGIVGMKEGEKRKLFVHPDLGYGTAGQLPPNSLLIFEIEVLKADTGSDETANPAGADQEEDEDLSEEGEESSGFSWPKW